MVEMIHSRRSSKKKEERYDLFSSLLDASEEEDLSSGETKLKDSELIGLFLYFEYINQRVLKYLNRRQYLYFPISWTRGTYMAYISILTKV